MPEISHESFEYYFVAYIDILGFSEMVESDIKNPNGSNRYLTKLVHIYENTRKTSHDYQQLQVIQFSDSVVFASPFDKELFIDFVKIVGQYQYNLFVEGLLCRGGISFGKHFYDNGFLFSSGLIEAYSIERNISRYPRIAVGRELLELLYPLGTRKEDQILQENDETYFVDFIPKSDIKNAAEYLKEILDQNNSKDPSVKEKHRWLCEYFDFKSHEAHEEIKKFSNPRFSEISQ